MPKMYNPDTQEIVDADGREVQDRRAAGFVPVGNRPEAEYLGRSRDELQDDGGDVTPETPAPEA
jgi:hypothetical protein